MALMTGFLNICMFGYIFIILTIKLPLYIHLLSINFVKRLYLKYRAFFGDENIIVGYILPYMDITRSAIGF